MYGDIPPYILRYAGIGGCQAVFWPPEEFSLRFTSAWHKTSKVYPPYAVSDLSDGSVRSGGSVGSVRPVGRLGPVGHLYVHFGFPAAGRRLSRICLRLAVRARLPIIEFLDYFGGERFGHCEGSPEDEALDAKLVSERVFGGGHGIPRPFCLPEILGPHVQSAAQDVHRALRIPGVAGGSRASFSGLSPLQPDDLHCLRPLRGIAR